MAGRSRMPRPEIPLYHHLSNLSIGNLAKSPTNYSPEFGYFANRQECNNLLYCEYSKGKGIQTMYYTHDFSTEKFSTREECAEELLSSMDSLDISEFLTQRVSLSDIIDERATRDPEDFYDWLDREIEIATNTYLNYHINEHMGHMEDLE